VSLADAELSDGMVVESDTNSTVATGMVVGPFVPQLPANDGELQSLELPPPHAASNSGSSAESHLNLRILFTGAIDP
jgi:hypothetical protein